MDVLEAGRRAAAHAPCTLCLIWAHVGMGGLCKGLLEEDCALLPFCSPRLPKTDLLSTLPPGSGSGDWAFAEIQPEERHWADVSSKSSETLPHCAKGEVEWSCLFTALRRAFQIYGYNHLCNNICFFRGEKNLFAVSPKTPLTGLAQRI